MPRTVDSVYREFSELYGDSLPIRSPDELRAAMRAADVSGDQATREWLQSLNRQWVYGKADYPFDDELSNRAYWRMLGQL